MRATSCTRTRLLPAPALCQNSTRWARTGASSSGTWRPYPTSRGFAAANDLVGKTDDEVREAIGDKFPKHIYHSIVCIGALVAHREPDHWAVDALGAPHVGERTEKQLISAFVDRIAELQPAARHLQRQQLRPAGPALPSHDQPGLGSRAVGPPLLQPIHRRRARPLRHPLVVQPAREGRAERAEPDHGAARESPTA